MKKIRFSHHYSKLASINCIEAKPVKLIEALMIDIKDLSKEFLDYDTDDGLYKLPKSGRFLLLIFLVEGVLFTTIRSAYPPSKVEYYKKAIGSEFQVIIEKQ